MFNIGVWAIIINDQNQILLNHRRDCDLWNLCGGRLENGESPMAGCLREVKEETGFDAAVEKLTGIYYNKDKDEVSLAFLCRIIGGVWRENDESDRIGWFDINEIPANTSTKQVERVKDYLENTSKSFDSVFKIQTGDFFKDLIKKL